MIGFFRRLLKDRRGNALAIAAAALPLVIGCAGLATDTIQWTLWKRQLQRAADSAAIAGVYDREGNSGSTSTVSATVTHDLSLNDHTWMSLATGYPQVTYPADSGVKTDQVQVTLAIQQRLPFSSLFMSSPPLITASATAASLPAGGDACIEALDTASVTGVTFSGNAAVEMPNCDIFSNTAGTNSAVGKGSSSVIANSVGGVGGIQQSNNFTVNSYRPYSPALADPFANINPAASDMKCAGHNVTTTHGHTTTTTWVYDELTSTTDMTAARAQDGSQANCWTDMSVSPNQTLTVPASYAGPIFLNAANGSGNATIQGNFSCSDCSIVLTNSSTATSPTIGSLSVNASSNINITAPTSGTYAGMAVMQDRRAASCTGNCNNINGNSGSIITGAIYFPSQEIWYNGTGNTTATCTMFVAKRITFNGNSGTSNKFKSLADCSSAGLPSSSSTKMVRLVA